MNLTNKNNNIVKLFISNILEQDGGKKGGKKGKKGKKAKKKKKKKKKNEGDDSEERESPERSESSSDVDSSPDGSSPRGIHSQIITSDVVPSNLQIEIDTQKEINTRQDTEINQLREILFQDQTDEIKLLKQNEEEIRRNEISKILDEIEILKKMVEENKINNLSETSSNEVPLEQPIVDPTLPVPPDEIENIQSSVTKKYEIKYD